MMSKFWMLSILGLAMGLNHLLAQAPPVTVPPAPVAVLRVRVDADEPKAQPTTPVRMVVSDLPKPVEQHVIVEMKVLEVPSDHAALKPCVSCNAPITMTAEQLESFLAAVQTHRHTSMMCAPKMVAANNQNVQVQVGGVHNTVTYVQKTIEGKNVMIPKVEAQPIGFTAKIVPTVSADKKTVTLMLDAQDCRVNPNTIKVPYTMMLTPEYEGGSQGKPIPYTVIRELAVFDTVSTNQTLKVPVEQTVVVRLGSVKEQATQTTATPVPVISNLPYLDRLFKNNVATTVDKELIGCVTVRLTEPQAMAVAGMPMAAPPVMVTPPVMKQVAGVALPKPVAVDPLMVAYKKACAADNKDEAARLALQLLAKDPTCFGK